MDNVAFPRGPAGNSAGTAKYYVVWIDSNGKRHAGGTPWSKFVAACFCDSEHYRNPQSGLVREDRLYDWFLIENPMSLTEDYKVRVKQRYITISNSIMEFNMRSKGNGVQVYRKGCEPIYFESDSETTAASKAKAYIDEQLQLTDALQPGQRDPNVRPVERCQVVNAD